MPLLSGKGQIPPQPLPTDPPVPLWTPSWPKSHPPHLQLVTNEYAHWNPEDSKAVRTADWSMDSGSLFVDTDGAGWTGHINDKAPDRESRHGTNSAVFRLTTRRNDFADVRVSFELYLTRLTHTPSTEAVAWDGIHVFLRYQSEFDLYYASVARRDGRVVAKRKTPGGPSNGGTYTELSDEVRGHRMPHHVWTPVAATIRTTEAGVEVSIERGGSVIYTAVDPGGLVLPGAVGIRGDNADFRFRNFEVRAA